VSRRACRGGRDGRSAVHERDERTDAGLGRRTPGSCRDATGVFYRTSERLQPPSEREHAAGEERQDAQRQRHAEADPDVTTLERVGPVSDPLGDERTVLVPLGVVERVTPVSAGGVVARELERPRRVRLGLDDDRPVPLGAADGRQRRRRERCAVDDEVSGVRGRPGFVDGVGTEPVGRDPVPVVGVSVGRE
jgi:hypothetical protein